MAARFSMSIQTGFKAHLSSSAVGTAFLLEIKAARA
jgi:hypothetical protein